MDNNNHNHHANDDGGRARDLNPDSNAGQVSNPESGRTPAKKIRTCPYCKQPYEIASPWKALWRMPTLQEWLILFMMAMMIFAAWAYKHDIQVCRDFIANNSGVYVGNFNQIPNYSNQPIDSNKLIINDTVPEPNTITTGGEGNISNQTK